MGITKIEIEIKEKQAELDRRREESERAGKKVITETKIVPYKPSWFEEKVLPFVVGAVGICGGYWIAYLFWGDGECEDQCVTTLSKGNPDDVAWATSTCKLLRHSDVKNVFAKGEAYAPGLVAGTAKHAVNNE